MILYKGFSEGFMLNHFGPRCRIESKNLHSVIRNPRCSPIGVILKKTGGFRLITHLSFPPNLSVNDFIDEKFTTVTVKYSSFDNAIDMIKRLGSNVEIGKKDIKSAFRLLKIYPGDFDLLGFKLN